MVIRVYLLRQTLIVITAPILPDIFLHKEEPLIIGFMHMLLMELMTMLVIFPGESMLVAATPVVLIKN